MLSASQIKFIKSLHLKKYRDSERLFIAEGLKVVDELLRSNMILHSIYGTEVWLNTHSSLLKNKKAVHEVSTTELEKISTLSTPNEVIALFETPMPDFSIHHLAGNLSLVLDRIKDPGNLGTIIRIADWFGIEHIICSYETVEAFNPKTIQSTMGSIARVKINYLPLEDFFENNKNTLQLPVWGAVMDGKELQRSNIKNQAALLLMGSESHGISKTLEKFIRERITISPFTTKYNHEKPESLNAAIATAIICYEFRRNNS